MGCGPLDQSTADDYEDDYEDDYRENCELVIA